MAEDDSRKVTPWFSICCCLFFCVFVSRTLENLDEEFCDTVRPYIKRMGAFIHYGVLEYWSPGVLANRRNITSRTSRHKAVRFSVQEAWQMLVLSSAAYTNHPYTKCLKSAPMDLAQKRFNESDFKVENTVSAPCDLAGTECFAFTGYSKSMRYIYVAFRGTEKPFQLLNELALTVLSTRYKVKGGLVQRYFKRAFDVLWPCLKISLKKLHRKYPKYHMYVTGHSLGGALSNLAAVKIIEEGIAKSKHTTHITFGEPRVGDMKWADYHDRLIPNSFRVVHYKDLVTHMPPCADVKQSKKSDHWDSHECEVPGANHQHGIEVYYKAADMHLNSSFKLCEGKPKNEDDSCSNKAVGYDGCRKAGECVVYHCNYYGIPIGSWPMANCSMVGHDLTKFLSNLPKKPTINLESHVKASVNIFRFILRTMGVNFAAMCKMRKGT